MRCTQLLKLETARNGHDQEELSLRRFRKSASDGAEMTSQSSLFQRLLPATGNARSSTVKNNPKFQPPTGMKNFRHIFRVAASIALGPTAEAAAALLTIAYVHVCSIDSERLWYIGLFIFISRV